MSHFINYIIIFKHNPLITITVSLPTLNSSCKWVRREGRATPKNPNPLIDLIPFIQLNLISFTLLSANCQGMLFWYETKGYIFVLKLLKHTWNIINFISLTYLSRIIFFKNAWLYLQGTNFLIVLTNVKTTLTYHRLCISNKKQIYAVLEPTCSIIPIFM